MAVLNKLAGLPVVEKLGLRQPVEKVVYQGTKVGFRTAGVAARQFQAATKPKAAARPRSAGSSDLFDLTPTDEQKMIVDACRAFAAEQLRPAASAADTACAAPPELLQRVNNELGVTFVAVPGSLGGAGDERSAVTNVLVAEALAHGDMGLAVAALAPAAVCNALVLWGDEAQQATYLPSFVGESVPVAALAVLEPSTLFDPFDLTTTATRTVGGGFRLAGTKSLVPGAAQAELFVVAAMLDGAPRLFVVEGGSEGLTIESEPGMGLRAASTARVLLDDVTVPATAALGSTDDYRDAIRLSRLGWASLAVGAGQAVLDHVIPYVNDRTAFGEPVSNRQAVAFMVANIGIELEGMRLATYRAAALAEQGRDFGQATAHARRLTAEYGMRIGTDGVQLLGGHGFVKEHPVERWYRDLRAVGLMEGAVLV
ncbi:acyl-CoA dehydrogenase family protein [Jatrophihabitans sp. YIM 134969]